MSLSLQEAYNIAQAHIADGTRITNAREGTTSWFFAVGDSLVDAIPGFSPIIIDKTTGKHSYQLPSVPSDILGKTPLSIEIEADNAKEVPLPE